MTNMFDLPDQGDLPASRGPIRLLIVDDHPIVREGLRAMLQTRRINVVGEAATGSQAVEAVRRLRPDVILMDIRMPDMDGLTATETIKGEYPAIAVIVLTSYTSTEYLKRAIQAGAAGYLLKGASQGELIDAVTLVTQGGSIIEAGLLPQLLQEMPRGNPEIESAKQAVMQSLSPLELQVLRLIVNGCSDEDVLQELSCEPATFHAAVQEVIQRLGASDRVQAVVQAMRAGLPEDVPAVLRRVESPKERGTVHRMLRQRRFGYIQTSVGAMLYFNKLGVLDDAFESLHVGQAVEFDRLRDSAIRVRPVRDPGISDLAASHRLSF